MFRLNRNKHKTNRNSLIRIIFWYFLKKIYRFFRIFWVFFETVCFGCFASIPKQRVLVFQMNRNKQKTNPISLKESIFGFFSENLGLFYRTVLIVSVVSIYVRNTETNQNKPKQTEIFWFCFHKTNWNRSCYGLFRFELKFFFVCFEDTLAGGFGGSLNVCCKRFWEDISDGF